VIVALEPDAAPEPETGLVRVKPYSDLPQSLRIRCEIDVAARTLRCSVPEDRVHPAKLATSPAGAKPELAPLVLPLPDPATYRTVYDAPRFSMGSGAPGSSTAAANNEDRPRYVLERSKATALVVEEAPEACEWFQRALGRPNLRLVRFLSPRHIDENPDARGAATVCDSDVALAQAFGTLHAIPVDGFDWLADHLPTDADRRDATMYRVERYHGNLLVHWLTMEEVDGMARGRLALRPLWVRSKAEDQAPHDAMHPLSEYVAPAPTTAAASEADQGAPVWASLKFGKWTGRCFLPTCSPVDGAPHGKYEPTATLRKLRSALQYHQLPGGPAEGAAAKGMFGVDWMHTGVGVLMPGAVVQSLEAQPAPVFLPEPVPA
jgi:hypothetical protein